MTGLRAASIARGRRKTRNRIIEQSSKNKEVAAAQRAVTIAAALQLQTPRCIGLLRLHFD
ncbi:hypothetical protein RR46_03681 [Papilio xuthus]|uniref:Uncharacterized protein n=1 Tax=Papilio xuthus TaxID=66420 RepID=A0A194Q0K8_PAPXU|nr:hypothetical protein RR46_03681 [Papilio xuthus]